MMTRMLPNKLDKQETVFLYITDGYSQFWMTIIILASPLE